MTDTGDGQAHPLAQWIEQRSHRWHEGRTDALFKASPMQRLTKAMRELLAALERCDFDSMLQPLGWWRRMTGERVLNEVRFRVADREIAHLMAAAQACADEQLKWHRQWQAVVHEHQAFVRGLMERIRIEQRLLQTEPPEEREARALQLQNAQLVLTSAQLTAQQFKLLQAKHDTVLARFHDIKHKLLPIWLDQLTAVIHGRALQAAHLQAAMKTYEALSSRLRNDLQHAETEELT